jgi:hypothetical protein
MFYWTQLIRGRMENQVIMDIMQFLEWALYGNPVRQWLLAGLTVLGVFTILMLARRILFKRMASLAGKTGTGVDDVAADLLNRTHLGFRAMLITL